MVQAGRPLVEADGSGAGHIRLDAAPKRDRRRVVPALDALQCGRCRWLSDRGQHIGSTRRAEPTRAAPVRRGCTAAHHAAVSRVIGRGYPCRSVRRIRQLHVVTELADGSYLSVLLTDIERQRIRRHRARGLHTVPQGPTVRVIEYDIVNRDSHSGSPIRLITTILDPEQASAGELAAVYHQRWEFESSLAEIETRQRGSYRVLRSHSPEMVRQEIWALLLTHYAIRALDV